MANNTIEKYIMPFEKRKQFAQTTLFQQMLTVWNEEKYQTDQKEGSIPYLLKKAHEEYTTKHPETPVMSRVEWGLFYNTSGKERLEKLKTERDSFNLNIYHGRTVADFAPIARDFCETLRLRGFNVSSSICLNFIYFMIVDFSYVDYVRQIQTLRGFCAKNPNTKYKLTDPLTCLNNGVDAIIFSNDDKLLFAMQILPESYLKDTPRNQKIKMLNQQKHDSFEYIYHIKVKTVYASTKGYIKYVEPKSNNSSSV